MLNFGFSEEQEKFRESLRKFASKEVAPRCSEWDRNGIYPIELYSKVSKIGLAGLVIPQKYGGQGSDYVTLGIALEEMGRADFSFTLPLMCLPLVAGILSKYGSDRLKKKWLPPMSQGKILVGAAITEPDCGSDAAAIRMRAVRQGNHYTLTGEKWSISFTMANMFLIFAKTAPHKKAKGVSAFVVPSDLPGFSKTVYKDMGCRCISRGSLHLEEVKIPVENRVGEEDQGFKMIMEEFDYSKVAIGLMAMGAAQASLEEAIHYAKQRSAFGKPIAKFEGISFPIAEAATFIEAARLLCYKTLWMRDRGIKHTKEAAMCKWWALKLAVKIIHQALLIFGSPGYSQDYPLEQRLRDVIGWEIGDGTAEIQKIIISREMMGRDFLPYER